MVVTAPASLLVATTLPEVVDEPLGMLAAPMVAALVIDESQFSLRLAKGNLKLGSLSTLYV